MASTTYICTLSPEIEKQAQKELNEKVKWRERDAQALREKVLLHKGIKSRVDDAFLLRFLRARKFDYDRSYQLLVNYYTTRALYKEDFGILTPKAIPEMLESGVSIFLPTCDKEGRRIMYFRLAKWNPQSFPMMAILRNHLLNLEKIITEEDNQVKGIVAIVDLAGLTPAVMTHLDRNYFKVIAAVIQDAFPLRLKAVHMVHEMALFHLIFAMVKQFLKSKTINRIHLHGNDMSSLHKHISPENLPTSLGGTLGDADEISKSWRKELEADEDIFQEMLPYHIELPRIITTKKERGEPGAVEMVGTYKKLNVD